MIIPRTLRPDVLQAGHVGHPGKESMTRQLRLSCWWPGYSADIREFQETCLPCAAAVDRNTMPPMQIRDRPRQHCTAAYKGPIAGKYYFHMILLTPEQASSHTPHVIRYSPTLLFCTEYSPFFSFFSEIFIILAQNLLNIL